MRAVPAELIGPFAALNEGRPLHVHLSEQRAENEACLACHGAPRPSCSPTPARSGPATTAVHATHLTDLDRTELGDTDTGVCLCPTTERDLADGIGPARALADAGSPLSLGSDSHAVIDLFEEARAVELDERLRTERRGHFSAADLRPGGHRHRAPVARLGRRRHDRRRTRAPTWSPSAWTRVRTAGVAAGRRRSSRPAPPTSPTWSSTAGWWSATATTCGSTSPAELARAVDALW